MSNAILYLIFIFFSPLFWWITLLDFFFLNIKLFFLGKTHLVVMFILYVTDLIC